MEAMMASFSAREAAHFEAKTAFAAAFLKVAALACGFVTWVLAAIVLSWQAAAWILTGKWSSFPISRVLALAGFDHPPAVQMATGIFTIFDWSLDLPVSGLLLVVAAVLIGFSVLAATIEEQLGKK
jgi:hypothetical protein